MRNRTILMAALFFALSQTALLTDLRPVVAAESQELIRIMLEPSRFRENRSHGSAVTGGEEPLKPIVIEPAALEIDRGSLVIWVNWARGAPSVKVLFEDGNHCQDATEAPTGFGMDKGCYVTSWMPFGGTSSLRFNVPGTYTYLVEAEAPGQAPKASGQITVK